MTAALLAFLVAVNPGAAARAFVPDRRRDRPRALAAGWALATLVLIALAVVSEPMLDAADLSAGTFRLGAGVVIGALGLRWMVLGGPAGVPEPDSDRALAGFVAFPTLLTPGAVVLAVSTGAVDGVGVTAAAAAVGTAAGTVGLYLRHRVPAAFFLGLLRVVGAGAVVVGVDLGYDGVSIM